MTVVTSKPSPVQIGQGRNKETIYTATRTTKLADGTYSVEMLQYSNAKGQGGKVIAERDSVNEWTFKDGVSKKIKQNEGRLNSASKNQMESMRGDFVTKSQEAEAYNSANGNRKTAPDPPETGDNSRPSGAIKADAKTRDSFPTGLRYPVDMAEAQDVIKFDMLKYEPKKVSGFGFSERNSDRASIGSVILPIPGGISDANACDWGGDSMNPLQIAGAGIALSMLDNDSVVGDGLSGALGDLKNQVVSATGAVKGAIGGATAASAIGSDINSLLGRTQGVILNPNLELLFQRPSLRPFSFEFKMSPRSSAEAARIVEIIRFFKQGMAPIRDESRLFLKTPHTFRIKYVQQGEDSKFLNRFKECALLSCNVQYTPEGNYAPYEDGAMSSYAMSLQFKELEPVYNDEYSDFDDTNIGF